MAIDIDPGEVVTAPGLWWSLCRDEAPMLAVENQGHSSLGTALPALPQSGRRRHVGPRMAPGRPRRSLMREPPWVGMREPRCGCHGAETESMALVQTAYQIGHETPSGLGKVGFVWLSPGHVCLLTVRCTMHQVFINLPPHCLVRPRVLTRGAQQVGRARCNVVHSNHQVR